MQKKSDKKKFPKKNHPMFWVPRTTGQKAADVLTKWAGSWTFISLFGVLMILWIIINSYFFVMYKFGRPWDPYPFILLNLVLSCLAALQAPIILMSQNRQVEKDRLKAEYDHAINRKAEKEIREIKNMIMKQQGR